MWARATFATLDEWTPSPEEAPKTPEWAKGLLRQPRIRLGAIIAVALIAGIVAWIIVSQKSAPSTTSGGPVATEITPVALSASGLAKLAHTVGQPVYWAGPRKHYLYELHRTTNGNIYIRYLPPGVDAGAPGQAT